MSFAPHLVNLFHPMSREEDIIALMGHTDYKVDIDHYIIQEVDTLYNAIKLLA